MDATLSRSGTSVSIELLESGGTVLVARDVGKPNLNIQDSGTINPRFIDQWSGLNQYTLKGRLMGSDAYDRAITLCDLIKSNGNGTPITLNIPMDEFDDNIQVVPGSGQEEALAVAYNPGWKNYVEVDLSLTRVSTSVGYDQPASTPTASGSGPIQLTDGSRTVDLVEDVTVQRGVGRPESTIRKQQKDFPFHVDTHKTAFDGFELEFEFTENAVATLQELAAMFGRQLTRNPLTLDFQGLFGMGSFSVVPDGSGALRSIRSAGEESVTPIPTVSLRRVFSK